MKHRLSTTGVLQHTDMLVSTYDPHSSINSMDFDHEGFLKFVTNIYALCEIMESVTSGEHIASSFITLHAKVDGYRRKIQRNAHIFYKCTHVY